MTANTGAILALVLMVSGCAAVDDTILTAPREAIDMDALIAENAASSARMVAETQHLDVAEETLRWVKEQGALRGRDTAGAMQEKFAGTLTADEQSKLETYFAANGVALESLTFNGRIVAEGDILFDADELLAALDAGVVEKGKTPAAVISGSTGGFPNGAVVLSRCSPAAAASVTSCASVGAVYQFFRSVSGFYYLIVPDSPAFLFNMFVFLSNTLENVSGDSIASSSYTVIRQSEYNALPELTRLGVHSIQVAYSPTACGSGSTAAACNVFPQIQTTLATPFPNPVFNHDLSFGAYLGIRSTAIQFDTLPNEGKILHELLHGIGLAHPSEVGQTLQALYVPGTSTAIVSSIMIAITTSPFWSQTMTAEDLDMIRTLYPSSGSYTGTYVTVNAN